MNAITHQQALDKLAAHQLVQVIEDDVASLTSTAMSHAKHEQQMTLAGYVLPGLMARWNCVLAASDSEATPLLAATGLYVMSDMFSLQTMLRKTGLT